MPIKRYVVYLSINPFDRQFCAFTKGLVMKRLLTCLVGLVTLTTSGCMYALLTDTPTRVIHRSVACPTTDKAKAKGFQVLSTHRWSKGVIVLYSALCPGGDTKTSMQQVFGHQVVKRNGMNWQVSSSHSYGIRKAKKPSEKLIEYGISQTKSAEGNSQNGEAERYTILYGQMLTPKVAAVEATFDNGQILRDNGKSGVFALIHRVQRGFVSCEF